MKKDNKKATKITCIPKEIQVPKEDIKSQIKTGLIQAYDNINNTFDGTIKSALKNGYKLDEHYFIIPRDYFCKLLNEDRLLDLSREFLINTGKEEGIKIGEQNVFDAYLKEGIDLKSQIEKDIKELNYKHGKIKKPTCYTKRCGICEELDVLKAKLEGIKIGEQNVLQGEDK
jgi:hypothetical protein